MYNAFSTGRGAVRLACLHGVQEVEGSNPFAPTEKTFGVIQGSFFLVLARSPDLARVLTEGLKPFLGYPFNWLGDQLNSNGRPNGQVPRAIPQGDYSHRRPARTEDHILSS